MKVNRDPWEPHVPKLLEIAGAAGNDATAGLLDHLEVADFQIGMTPRRPPPRLLKQLRQHLNKTIELLERLKQYDPIEPSLSWLYTTEDGGKQVISAREALRDIQSNIDNPRMGAPAQEDRDIAVSEAAQFFADHSPHGLNSEVFIRFCELFYLAATGTAVDGAMDYAVRKVREARRHCN
jgi:hypothetical protein